MQHARCDMLSGGQLVQTASHEMSVLQRQLPGENATNTGTTGI